MGRFHFALIQLLKYLAGIIIGLILSVLIVVGLDAILETPNPFGVPNPNLWLIGAVIAVSVLFSTWVVFKILAYKEIETEGMSKLPSAVSELINDIICNMRYRRSVRAEVSQEMADHFTDAFSGCKDEAAKAALAHEMIEEFGDAKLLGVLLRRAKKRCRPMWRTAFVRGFQAVGILVLFLIAHCIYLSFAKPVISVNYLAEITRLNQPVADESTNAAVLYKEAFELYKDEPMIEVQEEGKSRTKEMELLHAILDRKRIAVLSEEELSLMRQWVDDNQEALESFKAGSRKPNCWWERDYEDAPMVLAIPFDELKPMRDLAKLICWRGKLYAADGRYEEAIDDLLCCYRAGGHFRGPRSLIQQIVGIAIQILSINSTLIVVEDNKIDSEFLEDIQNKFEQLRSKNIYITNYEVERFFVLDFLQRCYTDNGRGNGRMIPRHLAEYYGGLTGTFPGEGFIGHGISLGMSLVSANRKQITNETQKIFDTAERLAVKTPWQLKNEEVDLSMGLDNWSTYKELRFWPVAPLVQALAKCGEFGHRNKADVDALITIVALLRYERGHGEYPESLDALIEEGLLTGMPMDPYSGQPLVYKRTDDGFALYSVGKDFTDDGGKRNKLWGGGDDGGDRVFWPMETYEQLSERIKQKRKNNKVGNPITLSPN